MDETTSDTVIAGAFRAAPAHIQTYLSSAEFAAFCVGLEKKFNLHADVADMIVREIVLTLLGLTEPNELVYNLQIEAQVPQELVVPIIEEVNAIVFAKLRMATLRSNPRPSPEDAAASAQRISSPSAVTTSSSAPLSQMQASPAQQPVQMQTPAPPMQGRASTSSPPPTPPAIPSVPVPARTIKEDMAALQRTPQQVAGSVQPVPPPVLSAPPMPSTLPPASYVRPYLPSSPPAAPPPPPRVPGTDPYREPVE